MQQFIHLDYLLTNLVLCFNFTQIITILINDYSKFAIASLAYSK